MNSKNLIGIVIGAFVGALLALQFGMWWWAGIIVGACAGWLCGEPKELVAAVKRAWCSERPKDKWAHVSEEQKRLNRRFQWAHAFSIMSGASFFLSISFVLALFGLGRSGAELWLYVGVGAALFGGAWFGVLSLAIGAMGPPDHSHPRSQSEIDERWKLARQWWVDFNLFVIVFRALRWLLSERPVRFAVKAFLFAHTGDRRERFLFAGLGALVGWEYGNPLVGVAAALVLYPLSRKLARAVRERSVAPVVS
jgi:hypothetical protein